MRTAHVITRLIIGGAQENTLFNVDDQHHIHGDEVCLITGPGLGPEGTLEKRAVDRGLDLRVIPEMRRALHPTRDLKCYLSLKATLKDYKPDIVHTHSSKGRNSRTPRCVCSGDSLRAQYSRRCVSLWSAEVAVQRVSTGGKNGRSLVSALHHCL